MKYLQIDLINFLEVLLPNKYPKFLKIKKHDSSYIDATSSLFQEIEIWKVNLKQAF